MGAWTQSPLYEELVACPLLIYVPGITPSVSQALTSAVDLMPTVLDIMGQKVPVQVGGCSLLPILQDSKLKGREYVVSTHPFSNPADIVSSVNGQKRVDMTGSDTTVTTEEWSLLYCLMRSPMLYHLPSDPRQEKNVIQQYPEVAKELHRLLVDFMRENELAPNLLEPRLEMDL
jgi:arylsulfatase A-like enzyme